MKALMILLIVLVLVSSYGRPSELDPTELGAYVEGFVTGRMYDEGVVGVTVAIVKDGQRIFSRGYGFDDLEAQRHVDASRSLFRPGSISKTFTWTAIMQLHEQGELDLEEDIQSYLPNVAIAKAFDRPITVLDLMAHRPGFEESALGHLIGNKPEAVLSLVDYLNSHQPKRVYPPGEVPAYSNYGAGLAGLIVANVSGLPFEDYMEQRILLPLGMTHSTFREPWGSQRSGAMPHQCRTMSARDTYESVANIKTRRSSSSATWGRPVPCRQQRTTWRCGCWCIWAMVRCRVRGREWERAKPGSCRPTLQS